MDKELDDFLCEKQIDEYTSVFDINESLEE